MKEECDCFESSGLLILLGATIFGGALIGFLFGYIAAGGAW